MRGLVGLGSAVALAGLVIAGPAAAAEIVPLSYAASGVDGFYPDSTGGELIDGVVADRHFAVYAPAGDPYLGWRSVDPAVTFAFDGLKTFGRVVLWFDDFGGRAGVTAPTGISVTLAGQTFTNFSIGTPLDAGFAYADPNWGDGGGTPYTLDLGGLEASSVSVSIARGGEWTFVSEVDFFTDRATAVPEPATWGLMIAGFGLAGAGLRRRRLAAA